MSHWIKLLWLSFFTAVLGETVFFAVIDPQLLYLFGQPVDWPPMVVYSVGFFMFWGLTALTAALVALLQKPGEEVNREPEIRARHAREKDQLRSI
ncbi:hypothetical protein [Dechloromonas sp. A34]|uniref:hypothetical protein n=1 Tax=Dechloromonas sp. A34 TaxID=447588 RepID=UPI002248F44D|nr:hypothetical protein [Dechloromonas sp. A34]